MSLGKCLTFGDFEHLKGHLSYTATASGLLA